MMSEEMFIKLADYDVTCRTYEGHFLVTLAFDPNWVVLEPEDQRVQCRAHNGRYVYCAPVADGGLDAIFKAVQETVSYNEDAARKMELFQQKTEELSKIFIENDYEKLKDLTFTFVRRKKARAPKVEKEENKVEAVVEGKTDEDKEEEAIEQPTVVKDESVNTTVAEEPKPERQGFVRHNSVADVNDGFDEIEIPEEGVNI